MPAKDVKAYVKRNKNDAADAEAICEFVVACSAAARARRVAMLSRRRET
jgi:transposase